MTATRGRLAAALLAAVCVLGGGILYRKVRGSVTEPPLTAALGETIAVPDVPAADWCAPGFEPIAGGGCFAAASAHPAAPLLVYLHGRYAKDVAAGFAVLALRGRLGQCTAPELATWYCWPSNETNADAGPEFVDTWAVALAAAQERAGSPQRFLLGFSNGAYFAGLIASRGWLEADAFVVAHGGPVEPVHALRGTPPLLLLSADDDVAQDEMIRLDEELTRERWAHDGYARAGGHGLTDSDIDAALAFFARAREPLPLQPPLSLLALHRPVRHVRDAGDQGEIQTDESLPDGGAGAPGPAPDPGNADEVAPVAPRLPVAPLDPPTLTNPGTGTDPSTDD
jgi:predicted esterase